MTPLPPSNVPLAELRGVTHRFSGESTEEVLHDISLTIGNNDMVALLGPSGCGKSTILRILTGLIRPTEGTVAFKGEEIHDISPGVAMVFQNFALFPWLTVSQNILLGLHKQTLDDQEKFERLDKVIELVGLQGYANSLPKELSGGMKQRVGFARAIIAQPEILCLDEPFSALDVLTTETLRTELLRLWTDPDLALNSMVMVTHNIHEAVLMARKVVVLAAHPGRVQTVVDNTLPYPRDTDSPAFKHLVDQIHGILTQAILPDGPVTSVDVSVPAPEEADQAEAEARHAEHAATTAEGKAPAVHVVPVSPLPKALLSEVQGLVSFLGDEPEDIYDLSCQIGKDFAATLSVVKAAELLGFVDTPGQDVVLTPLGKRFNGLDTPEKREVLHEQIRRIKIFELILRLIDAAPEKVLEEDAIVDRLGRIFPHERARTLWKTILSWGRYAEMFGYDAHTHRVSRYERVTFTEAPEEEESPS